MCKIRKEQYCTLQNGIRKSPSKTSEIYANNNKEKKSVYCLVHIYLDPEREPQISEDDNITSLLEDLYPD